MGLFSSSRKKTRGPFQAAVEEQQRGNHAARFRDRQSESVRQRSAEYLRHGGPFGWHESANGHPYEQPGFGFYSGGNLAASRQRQQEPRRSVVADEGFGNIPPECSSDPLGPHLPFSPHQGYPGPGFGTHYGYDAGGPPWPGLDRWTGPGLWDPPYIRPEEPFLYPPHHDFDAYPLSTRLPPLRSLSSVRPSTGQRFVPRSRPLDTPTDPERPILDEFRPSRNLPMPNPHLPPVLNRDTPSHHPSPTWNAFADRAPRQFPGTRAANRPPPRPPGSYERLRPPHLQPGGVGGW